MEILEGKGGSGYFSEISNANGRNVQKEEGEDLRRCRGPGIQQNLPYHSSNREQNLNDYGTQNENASPLQIISGTFDAAVSF